MIKALTTRKMNRKGFTLIELIVVIAILAILAVIAVPRLIGFQDRARATADQQTAAQVKNAVALLWADKDIVLEPEAAVVAPALPVELFYTFNLSDIPAGGGSPTSAVGTVAGNITGTLTTPTDVADIAGLLTGANGLITDYDLKNTASRTIWVRVSTRGTVNVVLSSAEPAATTAAWNP